MLVSLYKIHKLFEIGFGSLYFSLELPSGTSTTVGLCHKRIIKMFKTGEKSHLGHYDETFFCGNLFRSVKITDLYRFLQSQTRTKKLL